MPHIIAFSPRTPPTWIACNLLRRELRSSLPPQCPAALGQRPRDLRKSTADLPPRRIRTIRLDEQLPASFTGTIPAIVHGDRAGHGFGNPYGTTSKQTSLLTVITNQRSQYFWIQDGNSMLPNLRLIRRAQQNIRANADCRNFSITGALYSPHAGTDHSRFLR